MKTVLYVHGKGGTAAEGAHYGPLFPGCGVFGLDYYSSTPREAGLEIRTAAERIREACGGVILVANSIGAFYSLHAGLDGLVDRAYLISPVVDMERLIRGMMQAANVTEAELEAKGVIPTASGAKLSWEYLRFVMDEPVVWNVPTHILYGGRDDLTPVETVRGFAKAHGATLTVMEDGEHWFHTEEQMRFLDDWIRRCRLSGEC